MLDYSKGIKSYLLDINILQKEEIFATVYNLLPDNGVWKLRKEAIGRYKFQEDKCRSLGAGLMLLYLFTINRLSNNDLICNKYGKLLLHDCSLNFSISHSGMYIACSAGYCANGIDIEQLSGGNRLVANRFFSPAECWALNQYGEEMFSVIWTLKESYIKAVGLGMSLPLHSFSVLGNHSEEAYQLVTQLLSGDQCQNNQLDACFRIAKFDDYKMAVCGFGVVSYDIIRLDCCRIVEYLMKKLNTVDGVTCDYT